MKTNNEVNKISKNNKNSKKKVRVHKIIADSGLCSRRNAEDLIRAGRVKINGEYAEIGQSADPNKDVITVDDQILEKQETKYIMMHKPFGVHTTTKDPYAQRTVISILEKAGVKERLYPVGRLDKNASGLLLLTNDGDWANSVIHPSVGFEKEYHVKTDKPLQSNQISLINKGIHLDDGFVNAKVKPVSRGFYSITLKAGRHKIVKRIFKYFDIHVTDLKRVRIGPYKLANLKMGEIKEIKPATIKQTSRKVKKTIPKISRFKREKLKEKIKESSKLDQRGKKKERLKKISPKIDQDYTKRRRQRERDETHKKKSRSTRSNENKREDHLKREPRRRSRFKNSEKENRDLSKGLKPKSGFTPFDRNKPLTTKKFKGTKRDNSDRVPRDQRAPVRSPFSKGSSDSKGPKRLHKAAASKPFNKEKALKRVGKKRTKKKNNWD